MSWIKTKDQKPIEAGKYFGLYKCREPLIVGFDNLCGFIDDDGNKLSGITHWMPLPEPPKTERND